MKRTERGVLGFYGSSVRHLLGARANSVLRRRRTYRIGEVDAVLPPGHRLPWFQSVFPEYDRYAADLLTDLTSGHSAVLLLDVGANVGDTTLMALAAVDGLQVKAVEGDPRFVTYLRENLGDISAVEIVDRFVSIPDRRRLSYAGNGSTGGFQPSEEDGLSARPAIEVKDLLADSTDYDVVIWKSDTDGLDIPILMAEWESLDKRCDVIWFEFDPFRDIDRGARIPDLCALLAASGRLLHIVDNTGRSMFTVPAAEAPSVLNGLARWMERSAVPGDVSYLDVWAVSPQLTTRDASTGEWRLGRAEDRPAE